MSDQEFLEAFERLEIAHLCHADHVRLAWLCLQGPRFSAGAERFCRQLGRYVRHQGAEAKYHETITWFYLVTLFARIQTGPPAGSWSGFARDNPDLLDPGLGVLRRRYADSTLQTPLARRVFLLPDA